MASSPRSIALGLALAFLALPAFAQDADPKAWAATAATGAFDLCRGDAPDAQAAAEHGEAVGWGPFTPYLEHPDGYRREAGGEARLSLRQEGGPSTGAELTVQSGLVVSETTATVRYFRCNVAADQDVSAQLTAYFTRLYGAPTGQAGGVTLWLSGSAAPGGARERDAPAAVAAAGAGARLIRVELSNERGLTRAKMSQFDNIGPASTP